ncbi:hypothetical protein CLV92_102185 [Kineococcus xinjiangensis]|uniref:Uncharacterized protein n=1 Tax=Kineococcus xinjiangensis TaxID=512762 RepID=A0A2S6IUS8_9ACTN|nr:RRQRL motif-containing zinc-binding protein [Kineococcus xinjiangensis]PPK98032.1 hypothetical protein CLV92_102185 [Kineococcus xinjiangensis]
MTFQRIETRRPFGAVAAPEVEAAGWVSYRWGSAPAGYATRRQLRMAGLCPGGKPPRAEVRWGRRLERVAYLYRLADAQPKRVPSAAQLTALGKAMAARRTCTACGRDAGYCVPTSTRVCVNCMFSDSGSAAVTSTRREEAA